MIVLAAESQNDSHHVQMRPTYGRGVEVAAALGPG